MLQKTGSLFIQLDCRAFDWNFNPQIIVYFDVEDASMVSGVPLAVSASLVIVLLM